jgi:predicted kinase
MATLHLICGLPGAGKTTLAMKLERSLPALRLTPDEWITQILGPRPPRPQLDAARDPFEALQWQVAARALELGLDVILDFGFWSRAEREDYRARASSLGAGSRVHLVEASEKELLARLATRAVEQTRNTFDVTPDDLRSWSSVFERPDTEELRPR